MWSLRRPRARVPLLLLAGALLGALALVTSTASAQRKIGYDEALAYVRTRNPDLSAAHERALQAWAEVDKARANLLPTGSLQLKYTRNSIASEVSSPEGTVTVQPLNQLDLSLAVKAPLFVPSEYATHAAARASAQGAEADVRAQTEALLASAATVFFTAVGADELVEAREHAIRVAEGTWELARRRFETGTVGRSEVTRAEVAMLRAQQRMLEARSERSSAYRALGLLMRIDEPFTLYADTLDSLDAVSVLPATTALERRSDATALRHRARAAELTLESERWRWAPTVTSSGEIREFNYTGFSTKERYVWKVDVVLEWQFLDGGLRSAQRRIAASAARDARQRLASLESTVRKDLAEASDAVQTARQLVRAASHTVELAKETLELVEHQYRSGKVAQLELLDAQDALVEANVELARAHFRAALALVESRRAAGKFSEQRAAPSPTRDRGGPK